MVLIGLLTKCFWDNITTRKFPNQVIHISKQDLLNMMNKIEHIEFKYPINGVNLNGSLNYLSKLEHLGKLNLKVYKVYKVMLII